MKNAIVTGGTRGIGLAIAKMLMREGYNVTVTYAHDESSAESCRQMLGESGCVFEIVRADNADHMQMREFAAKMRQKGHIDCLVCNAGITLRKPFEETEEEEWDKIIDVNLNSKAHLVRNLLPAIPPDSRIILIASMMGVLPHAISIPSGVSKAGIIALARNLVKVFAGTGTTVNAIVPGFVETEWHEGKSPEFRQRICDKIAAGRFASPDEIAEAVRFCIRSAYVNGSAIEISGGYCYR